MFDKIAKMFSIVRSVMKSFRGFVFGAFCLLALGCWQRAGIGEDSEVLDLCGAGVCGSEVDTASAAVDGGDTGTAVDTVPDTVPAIGTEVETENEPDSLSVVLDDLRHGILHPEEVYLEGTLDEGTSGFGVLAHVREPNIAIAGFPTSGSPTAQGLSPDGRMYTRTSGYNYWFECDGCPDWKPVGKPREIFPPDVSANDEIIENSCPADQEYVLGMRIGVDGKFIVSCWDHKYYTEDGIVTSITYPLSYGYDEKVLDCSWETETISLLDIVSDTRVILYDDTGNEFAGKPIAARATDSPTGFLLATKLSDRVYILWHIDNDGNVSELGEYPPAPDGFIPSGMAALDAQGGLYKIGFESYGSSVDNIAYFSLDGTVEIVYSENDNPIVKIHASHLVTGP